jgi:hypothetical protein
VVPSARIFRSAGHLATLLISIAAVVTPLGLYEAVVPSDAPTDRNFHYIVDSGIFGPGQGTPPRNESLPWSRVCDPGILSTCPSLTRNSSGANDSVDTSVPQSTVDLFSSGVSVLGDSVSSTFDIQWRSWTWTRLDKNGSAADASPVFPVGTTRQIAAVVLDNKLEVIEGLVLDAVNGSIGFRNHSAPPFTPYGSTWTEDLLFIQPVTQCVESNLTIEYTLPLHDIYNSSLEMTDVRLVDRGGFSMLNLTFPRWNQRETQTHPDFWTRAYQAAWLNNVYAMKVMNVSDIRPSNASNPGLLFQGGINSTLGKQFPLPRLGCSVSSAPSLISTLDTFACFAPMYYGQSFNLTPEVNSDYISEDIGKSAFPLAFHSILVRNAFLGPLWLTW